MDCQFTGTPRNEAQEEILTREQRERLAQFCRALAHPARIQIIQFLATVQTCFCGDIVKQLPLAQSTVSQHLKILKEAGMIQGEIDGLHTCYWLDREALSLFHSLVNTLP